MCAQKPSTRTKANRLIHALHGLTLQVNKTTTRPDGLVNASGEPDSADFGESTARGDGG